MPDPAPRPKDRFTAVYASFATLVAAWLASAGELDRDFGLSLLLVPLMLIPAASILLFLLSVLLNNLVRRRWRRFASALVALPVGTLTFSAVLAGAPYDRLRLERNRAGYMAVVAQLPERPRSRLAAWQVGESGGAAVTNMIDFMVYDDSGEIRRPRQAWSQAWRARARSIGPSSPPLLDPDVALAVRALSGHFFLVTEAY